MIPFRLISAATHADLMRARFLLAGMGYIGPVAKAVQELGRVAEVLRQERDKAEREAERFRPKRLEWQKGKGDVSTASVIPSGQLYARVSLGADGWTASIWTLGANRPPQPGYRVATAEAADEQEAKAKAEERAREVVYG